MNNVYVEIIKNMLSRARRINHKRWSRTFDSDGINYHRSMSDLLKGVEQIIEIIEKNQDCSNCPAMKKIDDLIDTLEQEFAVSKEIGQPFKICCIQNEIGGCLD